jgi:hypothetical protein
MSDEGFEGVEGDPEFLPEDVLAVIGLLGLHALDRLDPADAERVRLAARRSELVALLLAEARQAARALPEADVAEVLAPPATPPADLGERVVARVRRHRRARRRQAVTGAAAALVLGAGLFLAGRGTAPVPPPPPREALVFSVERGVDVLEGDLINHTWGVELELLVTDVVPGGVYRVEFVALDGRAVEAGSFLGVDERPVDCRMNAAILRDDVAAMRVFGPDGATVLESDLG